MTRYRLAIEMCDLMCCDADLVADPAGQWTKYNAADRRIIEAARRIAGLSPYTCNAMGHQVCRYCNSLKSMDDHADECPHGELRRAIEAADKGNE